MTEHQHAFTIPPSPAMHEDADFRMRCQCGVRQRGEPDIVTTDGYIHDMKVGDDARPATVIPAGRLAIMEMEAEA